MGSKNENKSVKFIQVECGYEFTVALSGPADNGSVYTWGSNKDGQLGHGYDHGSEARPMRVELLRMKDAKIKQIAAGAAHVVCLSTKGKVYTWGLGSHGQLGYCDIFPEDKIRSESTKPREVAMRKHQFFKSPLQYPKRDKIQWLPQLLEMSKNKYGPYEIVSVSAGYYHTVLVNALGRVFTFGDRNYGKLGLGTHPSESWIKKQLKFDDEKSSAMMLLIRICGSRGQDDNDEDAVDDVTSSSSDSDCEDDQTRGRFELSDPIWPDSRQKIPQMVESEIQYSEKDKTILELESKIVEVETLERPLCETEEELRNLDDQINMLKDLKETEYLDRPAISRIQKSKIVQASAGESHTIFVSETGEVFTCGDTFWGQVGIKKNHRPIEYRQNGLGDSLFTPRVLRKKKEEFSQGLVYVNDALQAAAGVRHSLYCTVDGDVYVMGCTLNGRLGMGEDVMKDCQKIPIPTMVKRGPAGMPIDAAHVIQVAAGSLHSCAVTGPKPVKEETKEILVPIDPKAEVPEEPQKNEGGHLFTWGGGAYGQLGHVEEVDGVLVGERKDVYNPKRVEYFVRNNLKVKQVSAGDYHTACVTEDGDIYMWGAYPYFPGEKNEYVDEKEACEDTQTRGKRKGKDKGPAIQDVPKKISPQTTKVRLP